MLTGAQAIDELVSGMDKSEPGFATRVRGADSARIARLEQAAGRALPASFRRWLERMGEDSADLHPFGEADSSLTHLLGYYEDFVTKGYVDVPPESVLIATGGDGAHDIVLDLHAGPEPSVHEADGSSLVVRLADSLPQLLFACVFRRYRLAAGTTWSSGRIDPALDRCRAIALQQGFVAEWFSDSVTFLATRPGAALEINQIPERGLNLTVATDHPGDAPRLAAPYLEALPLTLVRRKAG